MVKSLLNARLLDIRIGGYRFAPGVFTTLVTAGLLYTMISLGLWQAGKADFKHDLKTKIENRKDLSPVELHLLPGDADERRYLPVIMTGEFDDAHQFLYDNRIVNGVAGFHVYTPFHSDTGDTVLVNRGWIPQQRTRDTLPNVGVTSSRVTITGLVDKLPSKGVLLADDLHSEVRWPMILQYLDSEELSRLAGTELLPMIVWLDPETDYGYYHEYPSLNLDAAKNTGYAFQWFAMSAALSIIYIVVNTRRIH